MYIHDDAELSSVMSAKAGYERNKRRLATNRCSDFKRKKSCYRSPSLSPPDRNPAYPSSIDRLPKGLEGLLARMTGFGLVLM